MGENKKWRLPYGATTFLYIMRDLSQQLAFGELSYARHSSS